MTPERSKAEAKAKIARALFQIEEAQNLLASATAELTSAVGGVPVWRATSKMHDRVKALWYRVDGFKHAGRYSLDAINIEAIERREKFKGPAPAP